MENYEKKYKDALERAKKIVNDQNASSVWKGWLCNCFPELKESEDDRIRKCICLCLEECVHNDIIRDYEKDKCLAWLEKQGEQKPADKVEPKFKVGDWITNGATNPAQISSIKNGMYFTHNDTIGGDIESIDKEYHLWTIKDAKDGDVLATNSWLYILKYTNNKGIIQFHCSCPINGKPYKWSFLPDDSYLDIYTDANIHPATKEQRDLLFSKMKEAGYEWDAEKKELKKQDIVEIPFGAKDSELQEATYYIPKGFYSVLDGNKVIIKRFKNPRPQNN